MGAELCLGCNRDLLLSHSEGSMSHIHRCSLLKLLTTENLFLRFPASSEVHSQAPERQMQR